MSFAQQASHSHFRSQSALTDDQIRRIAPSVFAEEAHESRSARYTYIPTIEVVQQMRREGFQPFSVMQGRTRIPGKADFTKHMLRFRHASATLDALGQEINEITLINSHDGTSSYQMIAGVYRVACMNGLLVCKSTLEDIRIPHKGDVGHEVVNSAYQVLDGFGLITDVTHRMQGLQLSAPEQTVFAEAALTLKYGEGELEGEPLHTPITAQQLLRVRRAEDRAPDLWTTFNRVQENVIHGGIPGHNANGRRTRTREVTAIDTNVKLNRALWQLAERMAELKGA